MKRGLALFRGPWRLWAVGSIVHGGACRRKRSAPRNVTTPIPDAHAAAEPSGPVCRNRTLIGTP